jgi:uncharacterized protein
MFEFPYTQALLKLMKMSLARKIITILFCTPLFLYQVNAQPLKNTAQDVQAFPLKDVQLLPGIFKDAQQTDLAYMLALSTDRLLSPFLREAGFTPKDSSYGNWENTGLDGQTAGHYLSALANMYAATGNKEVFRRLNYMIDWLDSCQRKNGDGYVGGVPGGKKMWAEIESGRIRANSFSLNGKWVPWYNMHKLFAGLVDAYKIAGIPKAKLVVVKLADWSMNLTRNLTDAQMEQMLAAEQGGINEALANVAGITGDKKYLDLARRFSHRKILGPLMKGVDSLNGLHANTQIPKVVGFERISELSGEPDWGNAAKFFWQTVVDHRSVSVGGNSVSEHFNPAKNFASMIESREGIESCNSYNMLRLTKDLFLKQPQVKYIDYYERTTYNHILSTQNPEGGFVYFTPMRPRHYRVYSQPQNDFWCCVGTGLENHGKYGELIYAHQGDNIFVNLFIPSKLTWKEKGMTLVQNTKFPFEEGSQIKMQLQKPKQFLVRIRYPQWVAQGGLKLMVNNKPVAIDATPGTYATINRTWRNGDVISVQLPMHIEAESLPDGSPWVSFVHGPIVLAAVTDTTDLIGEKADASRMGHVARGPLYSVNEAPVLVTNQKDPAAEVTATNTGALTFQAANAIYPAKYKQLKLVPFFQVHNSRYMLYWPVTTPEGLQKKQQEIKEKEQATMALEKLTVDKVIAGEQQPETEHNFKGENTESGMNNDRHYRHARGWFSYELKDAGKEAKSISVTYYGTDGGRTFDIFLNDVLLQTVTLENKGSTFYDVKYAIPEALKNSTFTLRFAARNNSMAGGVYEVRLLK